MAQPVTNTLNHRQNMPSMGTPNATPRLPGERDQESGSSPNDHSKVVDQHLYEWVSKIQGGGCDGLELRISKQETNIRELVSILAFDTGKHGITNSADLQLFLKTQKKSILYLSHLDSKLHEADENEACWFEQQTEELRKTVDARKTLLDNLRTRIEHTKERISKIHDECKGEADRKGQETQEPAGKKRKLETKEDDKLKFEELDFADDLWEKMFDHGDDVRILGEFMAGLDKKARMVASFLLSSWNKLKRKHWKTFEGYTVAMKALGAGMDLLSEDQSATIWKSQMEARRKMKCFDTLRPMPVFTLEECCGEESESD